MSFRDKYIHFIIRESVHVVIVDVFIIRNRSRPSYVALKKKPESNMQMKGNSM